MYRASNQLICTFLRCGRRLGANSSLGQVVRLEELLKKSREEVIDIWLAYHSDAQGCRVGSVLSSQECDTFAARAAESPMFVLPLSKPAGYETLLVQCQMPYVLVTGLEEFKRSARTVTELLRAFYISSEDYQLVHTFNHQPAKFDFGALLRKLNIQA
ncbi:hypothetical protein VOLCADRAFT_86712 [Volvox carteri f. nagariensis]|uniref:Uncharacterized protein n=1 Tax=Volvox carteri f. nagariensis TaxID=3068 RepID=D8TJE5_VOLCA|nr:uncharacterized protein VOLCADRAFT_86712 [Volvox carteri f. nagariensis]EFJ52358.1 hypothetical protein VOLCADRAFT_86712 [Volvox carteri f. nagariensis]|eukprot:XP_002946431.1 hypothetical protein VOLCADRAFT_86712 [Volvox carteri f. nagariensis]